MWKGKADVRRALFGGRGSVSVWSLGHGPAPFEAVLGCELSPRGSVGPHAQEHCHELVTVISGRGLARVNGEPQGLSPGAVVTVPLGAVLELENRSKTSRLRYVIIKAVR